MIDVVRNRARPMDESETYIVDGRSEILEDVATSLVVLQAVAL